MKLISRSQALEMSLASIKRAEHERNGETTMSMHDSINLDWCPTHSNWYVNDCPGCATKAAICDDRIRVGQKLAALLNRWERISDDSDIEQFAATLQNGMEP